MEKTFVKFSFRKFIIASDISFLIQVLFLLLMFVVAGIWKPSDVNPSQAKDVLGFFCYSFCRVGVVIVIPLLLVINGIYGLLWLVRRISA